MICTAVSEPRFLLKVPRWHFLTTRLTDWGKLNIFFSKELVENRPIFRIGLSLVKSLKPLSCIMAIKQKSCSKVLISSPCLSSCNRKKKKKKEFLLTFQITPSKLILLSNFTILTYFSFPNRGSVSLKPYL